MPNRVDQLQRSANRVDSLQTPASVSRRQGPQLSVWNPSIWERAKMYLTTPEPAGGADRSDKPFRTMGKIGLIAGAEVISGLALGLPDIAAQKLTGEPTLGAAVAKGVGLERTPREETIGSTLKRLGTLRTMGVGVSGLMSKIPASVALKTILGAGATFGSAEAVDQTVKKITTGDPFDIEGIHFSSGVGVLFGTGAAGIRKLGLFIKGFRMTRALAKSGGLPKSGGRFPSSRAEALSEIHAAQAKGTDSPEWKAVMDKYVRAVKTAPPAVRPDTYPRQTSDIMKRANTGIRAAQARGDYQAVEAIKVIEQMQLTNVGKQIDTDNARMVAELAGIDRIKALTPAPEKPAEAPVAGGREGGFLSLPETPSPEALRAGAESIYQDTINRFASIENATKKAQKLGMKILSGENPGLRARSYLGLGRKVESVLNDKTYRITPEGQIEITGEGLKPILNDYDRIGKTFEKKRSQRKKDWNTYLDAQRTIHDLQRPKNEWTSHHIVTPEQVKKAKSDLEGLKRKYGTKGMANIEVQAKRLYEYQKRVLHGLVDGGNLSQKQYDDIIAKNKHYVPFDRIMDEDISGGVPVSKDRFTKARAPIKKIHGSEREKQDFTESIIKNTYRIMEAADRNSVARSIAKLAKVIPDDISPIRMTMIPIKLTPQEMAKFTETGETPEVTIFRPSQFAPKGRVIEYFEDGKRKYMEVSPNLYKAMTGLNEEGASFVFKILGKPAHWLRIGATSTPEFMARNVIRDQYTAWMNTHFGFKPFVDTTFAIADILGKTDAYYDWMRSGGAYSGFVELNRPSLEKAVKELTSSRSRKLLGKLNILADAQDISQVLEQATRVAVFKRAQKAGMTSIEAGFQSREATIDFGVRGGKMANINRVTAFLNAGVQGIDKSVRNVATHPVSTTIKGVSAITLPSLLLYYLGRDDPKIREIPRWQKDLFWIVPNPDPEGSPYRIPKTHLYGQVYGSIPERFLEYLDTKDPSAFDELGRTILESVVPVSGEPEGWILPTGLKPIIENWGDRNFFLERSIVPESRKDLLPPYQHGRYTTETAKEIGKILNYSPAKIENLIRGYTGGTGRYALEGSDYLINSIRAARGEPVPPSRPKSLSDIPLVKGFVVRDPLGPSAKSIQDFYRDSEQVISAYDTYNRIFGDVIIKKQTQQPLTPTEQRQYKLSQEFKGKHPELVLGPDMRSVRQLLAILNKQSEAIVQINMPDTEKRKKLKKIDAVRLKIAQNANRRLNK